MLGTLKYECNELKIDKGTLFSERRKLPVFEEKHLRDILEKIGLLEKMLSGEILCFFCKQTISKQNFGALFLPHASNEIAVSCNHPRCLGRIAEVVEE
jgi:hypothetical protein